MSLPEFKTLPKNIQNLWDTDSRSARATESLYITSKYLLEHAVWAHSELESWLADQGEYGTTGYEEMLPAMKSRIQALTQVINKLEEQ